MVNCFGTVIADIVAFCNSIAFCNSLWSVNVSENKVDAAILAE